MVPIKRSEFLRSDIPYVPDVMPRSLALSLVAGSLIGAGFWAALLVLLIR